MKALTNLSSKQKKRAAFLILVIVGVSYLLYAVAIPRAELSVTTVVHESFSGISLGITVKNTGTLDMRDVGMNITITDSEEKVRYVEDVRIGDLGKGEKIIHSFTYTAPQVGPYNVTLRFTYTCDGRDYNETINHRIEDYMNFVWKDKLRDWRF